jgi:thymidylate kinase
MLGIYRQLFTLLAENKCMYCIYKSLNFLLEDLSGTRGDLDILIPEEALSQFESIVVQAGFLKSKSHLSYPLYFIGRDEVTGQMVMLDVDIHIRLGHKPVRPFRFLPDWNRLKLQDIKKDGIVLCCLDNVDYLPLMLLMRISSKLPKPIDFVEIKGLAKKISPQFLTQSYFGSMVGAIITTAKIGRPILELVDAASSWQDLQSLLKAPILAYIEPNPIRNIFLFLTSPLWHGVRKIRMRLKQLLHIPPYRCHQGLLIAFVGVDGAGKTTVIETFANDPFYRCTGIKKIYFGNNHYWIPGLVFLATLCKHIRPLQLGVSQLMRIDRQMRVLKAIYLKWCGNIVLCDRYYYDDEYSANAQRKYLLTAKGAGRMVKRLSLFLRPRMLVIPDQTFFLNVSPEVAYRRKQDYDYQTMLEVNKGYRELMLGRPEVISIDADQPQDKVIHDIQGHIQQQIKVIPCIG